MIQEANIHDSITAQAIWAVQIAAYTIESQLIDYPSLPPLFEQVADLQAVNEIFLVYREANAIHGVLSYERHPDRLHICRLVVAPSHLGRGIASKLLATLETRRGTRTKVMVSTAQKNQPAVNLYRKQGYQLLEQRQLPDGLRLVLFEKVFYTT